jgi:hypothetical protein
MTMLDGTPAECEPQQKLGAQRLRACGRRRAPHGPGRDGVDADAVLGEQVHAQALGEGHDGALGARVVQDARRGLVRLDGARLRARARPNSRLLNRSGRAAPESAAELDLVLSNAWQPC